jgi:hypothetical protein
VLKSLSNESLNTMILMVLRDCKFLGFDDLLLGIIESSFCSGLIYLIVTWWSHKKNFKGFLALSMTDNGLSCSGRDVTCKTKSYFVC